MGKLWGRALEVLAGAPVLVLLIYESRHNAQPWELVGGLTAIVVAVAVTRRSPWLSLTAAAASSMAMLFDFGGRVPVWPVLLMVPFACLAGRRMESVRPALVTFLAVAGCAVPLSLAIGRYAMADWGAVAGVLLFAGVLPWQLGRYMRTRSDLVRAGWQRAEELELRQRIVADEARLRERARIASDMHDSLGHELSLIALRAAALEMSGNAEAKALRENAAAATERLREIIGVLREDAAAPVDPIQGGLTALIDRARTSGMTISFRNAQSTGDDRAPESTPGSSAPATPTEPALTQAPQSPSPSTPTTPVAPSDLDPAIPFAPQVSTAEPSAAVDGVWPDPGSRPGVVPLAAQAFTPEPPAALGDVSPDLGSRPAVVPFAAQAPTAKPPATPDGALSKRDPRPDALPASLTPAPSAYDAPDGAQSKPGSSAEPVVPAEHPRTPHDRPAHATAPPMVDRAIYRVVQEALTNVTKHAPGAAVTVSVTHAPGETVVRVCNGPPPAGPLPGVVSGGRGLAGLDERVRLLGGTLRAGPHDGGFEVVARLPHAAEPAPASPFQSESARQHGQARREVRRRLLAALVVPPSIMAALLGVVGIVYLYQWQTSVLDPADYEHLRPGQPRAEVAAVLPPRQRGPHITAPEPPGTTCEYYGTGRSIVQLRLDAYRLCFAGDRLVSKELLTDVREGT